MTTRQEFKDGLAKQLFDKTISDAHKDGTCINCNEDALTNCYSEAGEREYKISGLCEKCFDELLG